jgi:hypothetical protein
MAAWPVELPPNRVERAKLADVDRGLEALRRFVQRGCPYGWADWQKAIAKRPGLESAYVRRGAWLEPLSLSPRVRGTAVDEIDFASCPGRPSDSALLKRRARRAVGMAVALVLFVVCCVLVLSNVRATIWLAMKGKHSVFLTEMVRSNGRKALPILSEWLRSDDRVERQMAVLALRYVEPPDDSVPLLIVSLDDEPAGQPRYPQSLVLKR